MRVKKSALGSENPSAKMADADAAQQSPHAVSGPGAEGKSAKMSKDHKVACPSFDMASDASVTAVCAS